MGSRISKIYTRVNTQIMKKSSEEEVAEKRPSDYVLYRCNAFWICIKPAGMPIVPDKTGDPSLMDLMSKYAHHKFFAVHRLDRPVSGLVILASSKPVAATFSKMFKAGKVDKTYLAVTADKPEPSEGVLEDTLVTAEKVHKAFITEKDDEKGLKATLNYAYLGSSERYHLLKVQTHSGRFHQIRAQLAGAGWPIKGDVKYGSRRGNKDRSIHLHAWKLSFPHPVSGETCDYIAPVPAEDPVWAALVSSLPES